MWFRDRTADELRRSLQPGRKSALEWLPGMTTCCTPKLCHPRSVKTPRGNDDDDDDDDKQRHAMREHHLTPQLDDV